MYEPERSQGGKEGRRGRDPGPADEFPDETESKLEHEEGEGAAEAGDGRRVIAESKNSTVWLDESTGVVEKLIPDASVVSRAFHGRILDEGNVLALLRECPHVVDLVSWELTGERGFRVCTKWCSGGTLEDPSRHFGPRVTPNFSLFVRWWRDAAFGLAACAAKGIVHNDICPANIFIDDENRARLGDFGLAFFEGDEDVNWYSVVGRSGFMPPDSVRTTRSDVYALGLTVRAVARAHKIPIYGLLSPILNAQLKEDPKERITAAEVAERLENLFAN
jgi:serine/threonine protein kinase